MRLAEKLGMPVITFLDTAGAFPGPAAEERGQAEAIATSIKLMTGLQVPIVAVVLGEGGSGGALAIGVGDVVLALENAVYSVISPEGCASILWRDPEKAPVAAAAMRMTAADQLELGVIDGDHRGAEGRRPGRSGRHRHGRQGGDPEPRWRASARPNPEALLTSRYARLRSHRPGHRGRRARRRYRWSRSRCAGAIGRLLRLPGVPRPPRWSEIWPSGEDDGSERG